MSQIRWRPLHIWCVHTNWFLQSTWCLDTSWFLHTTWFLHNIRFLHTAWFLLWHGLLLFLRGRARLIWSQRIRGRRQKIFLKQLQLPTTMRRKAYRFTTTIPRLVPHFLHNITLFMLILCIMGTTLPLLGLLRTQIECRYSRPCGQRYLRPQFKARADLQTWGTNIKIGFCLGKEIPTTELRFRGP
jgi:hypothetical protein